MYHLRSCYSTQARFFYDSDSVLPIIWYWSHEGAPRFAGRHTFAPLSISGGSSSLGGIVGEQLGSSRPWRDGSIPMAPPSGVLDGAPSQFYQGQSTSGSGIARTSFGIPEGCAGGPIGAFCAFTTAQDYDFRLEMPKGKYIGNVRFNIGGSGWSVSDPLGNFAGHADCIQYTINPFGPYNMFVVTNLITGVPLPFYVFNYTAFDDEQPLVFTQLGSDFTGAWLVRLN